MAQRLAKKPISEGFELWDRGYTLGAMRLFIFKAETSPPFQLGPCLDAMGHLLAAIGEGQDAKENFGYAAEKYELIQQPILAQIMTALGLDASEGPAAALPVIQNLIATSDPSRQAHEMDAKHKSALGRAYYVRAYLLFSLDPEANAQAALDDAIYAAQCGWDRVHVAHFLIGEIKSQLGDAAGAVQAYENAIAANANHLESYLGLIGILSASDKPRALHYIDQAIAIHPRSALIRDKAFLLSELSGDNEAIQFLDAYIANPPHEETEALVMGGATSATLLKAKAAILADGGRLAEAAAAAQEALKLSPGDEEAERILADIQAVEQQQ